MIKSFFRIGFEQQNIFKEEMSMSMDYAQIENRLKQIGQAHLLAFYHQLTVAQQKKLLSQLAALDFDQIPRWVEQYVKNPQPLPLPTVFEPAPSYPPTPTTPALQEKYRRAMEIGKQAISAGKVAGFTVAGGQGTRLGFDGPKGDFPISPIRNKTLFGWFAETLIAAQRTYGATIPWYIMTSPLNHGATEAIFQRNGYFGLNPRDVFFFQQGTLPNFDLSGKILLADKDTIAESPDGHGGSLKALAKSGALADMRRRGIEYLSYWQIDNPLIKTIDPLFIGLHILDGSQMSSKALIKSHPLEKVGNFCKVDGKICVIEYSDLPDHQAMRRNPDGSLVFELGSIAIHILDVAFVEQLNANGECRLPLHRAVKKIPHIDQTGNPVNPSQPNGVKLEMFIFDALPMAKNAMILQTERVEEFAPVKNAEGADSPAVTRQMMIARAARWLQAAGVAVPTKPDGTPDCILEIAPTFALGPEQVKAKKDRIPAIKAGDRVLLENESV